MPYDNLRDLPQAVRDKLPRKKQEKWRAVWNSSYDRHGNEQRAYAEAWGSVKKAASPTEPAEPTPTQGGVIWTKGGQAWFR